MKPLAHPPPGHNPQPEGHPQCPDFLQKGNAVPDVPVIVPRMLTIAQCAKYLGVADWAVRRMVWSGALAVCKPGKNYLIDRADVDSWIDRNKRKL